LFIFIDFRRLFRHYYCRCRRHSAFAMPLACRHAISSPLLPDIDSLIIFILMPLMLRLMLIFDAAFFA
jgi:hypothetical protein